MMFKKTGTLLLLLFAFTALAQKQVQTSIDSTKIKIGSQANLTLKATVQAKDKVNFPQGKNFGLLEVLESYPVDTIKDGTRLQLIKKYGLTQFDSGRYVIPRLPVIINNKTFQTDSLALMVTNVKVDTLKQKMFDIKPVATAEGEGIAWWWWLIGAVALSGIGFGVWWFFLKKKKAAQKEVPMVHTTPIERATLQLKNLERKELVQKGEVKEYYSEMANIARTYIEEAIHIPAMESTTGELIAAMQSAVKRRKMRLKQDTFEQLEQILRNADLVKFAKSKPLEFEIAEDRAIVEKTIVVIDRSIPEEQPEDEDHTQLWLEEQRLKKQKRKKRIIIWSSVGAVVIALIVVPALWGVAYVKDNYFGYPTKELVAGQWVKSEYGNPGVNLETPKVLKRMDTESMVPKETMALIKEMQSFSYGSMLDYFYIEVATMSYKEPKDVNLDDVRDGIIKVWESRGAKDILLKTEEFKTDKGITGMRTYGSFNQPGIAGQGTVGCNYELFLFKQQNGLQQVLTVGQQGDNDAATIMERIKKSIELRSLNQ
jgi:hypothetical protein